jgi:phosphoribosylamine--glycine ligase
MKILILGSGGREAALAWKISQSPLATSVIVAPGNPGLTQLSSKISLFYPQNFSDYLELHPDLVVVGPEALLSEGVVDYLEENHIPVIGPTKAAAKLESSKVFCKEIFTEAGIPTARYQVVHNLFEAQEILKEWTFEGVVVKVDGLAQGKGVVVCQTAKEALESAEGFFNGAFLGYSVNRLVIEEMLVGPEVSVFALCDGEHFVNLGSATDYKRLHDNDKGPNTGGMGTVSPSPILTSSDEVWIDNNVFAPTLRVMKQRGIPFKGFLFAGLMKTKKGFFALEFNTRLGDPETQSLLPRMTEDFLPMLLKASQGQLLNLNLLSSSVAIHVVFSASGYPEVNGNEVRKGDALKIKPLSKETLFFTAAVTSKGNQLVSNGGRVCGLTVVGEDLRDVHEKIYQEALKINFDGVHYRKDIGKNFL